MKPEFNGLRTMVLAGSVLALAAVLGAQTTDTSSAQAGSTTASAPTSQPAPGTTPVGGDIPATTDAKQPPASYSDSQGQ